MESRHYAKLASAARYVATYKVSVVNGETGCAATPYGLAPVETDAKFTDIKNLARMAARLAGRDPDEHVAVKVGDVVAFDDLMWRDPDFISRAEAAYDLLKGPSPL